MTPDEAEFEERRKQSLWERFDALETECRRGHRALRQAINELEAQADAFDVAHKALSTDVGDLAKAPVEATKLRFSSAVIASVVFATFTVVGAGYGFSSMVTGRIDGLVSRMDQQTEKQRLERETTAKILDERYATSKSAIDGLTRQMELLKYEQQRLREDVTKPKGSLK